jgi:hypothetical protein
VSKHLASWTAVLSAFISSMLALHVALDLGVPEDLDVLGSGVDIATLSKWAAVAALAALVSTIAQIIERGSK